MGNFVINQELKIGSMNTFENKRHIQQIIEHIVSLYLIERIFRIKQNKNLKKIF